MSSILNAIVRGIISYLLLLIVTRIMGRKLISQMTFFDFVVANTLGTLAGSLGMGMDINSFTAASLIITLTILTVLTGYLDIKSITFSKLVNSEPVTLIDKGEIVKENMRKNRITINQLNSLLREKNIFNPADVEFAIMENNGELSILLKSEKQPLTPSDMGIPTAYKCLTRDIIIDGEVLEENLREANLDINWLFAQLKVLGINDLTNVFFAALDSSGKLYVSKGRKQNERQGEYGIE